MVASRAARILNQSGKAMMGARVLVLGVAYKQDIDDYRESPALRVIERLEEQRRGVVLRPLGAALLP